jgi:hypothetical protein
MRATATLAALCALGSLAGTAEAGVKCGDIISLRSVGNGRFWRTHREETLAVATGVGSDKRMMYNIGCKNKIDLDHVQLGDAVYLRNVASGEYLSDGGAADHEASTHNHLQTALGTMNKTAALSPLNEFVFARGSTEHDLNVRDEIDNMDKVAIRNRYTRFLTATTANNKILSAQFGEKALGKDALFTIDGFCPFLPGQKPCSSNGKCVDNRCECDQTHQGPVCEVPKHRAFCHAIGQSNVKTFDDAFYAVKSAGEYLMYASPSSAANEAVTIMFGSTAGAKAGAAPVPIAVSFRRGGDIVTVSTEAVVSINCGGDDSLAVRATKGQGFRTDSGLVIRYVDHDRVDIRSPSGSKLVVSSLAASINAFLHINEIRVGELKGLCGDFDGKGTDDLPESAKKVASYAIPSARSLLRCGKESSVAFLEVAPAFVGMEAFIGDGGARVIELLAANAEVEDTIHSRMDRAKAALHAALHGSCGGKMKANVITAKGACAKLAVSSTPEALGD